MSAYPRLAARVAALGRTNNRVYVPDPLGRVGEGQWVERKKLLDPVPRAPSEDVDPARIDFARPFALGGRVGYAGANRRDDVGKVQGLLALHGHHKVDPEIGPTGYFGSDLDLSVRGYQKARGLTVDGTLDPDGETIRSLGRDTARLAVAGNSESGDTPPSGGEPEPSPPPEPPKWEFPTEPRTPEQEQKDWEAMMKETEVPWIRDFMGGIAGGIRDLMDGLFGPAEPYTGPWINSPRG